MSVFVGMPVHNLQAHPVSVTSMNHASLNGKQHGRLEASCVRSSLLVYGFNQLLAAAANQRFDYFAMIHSDVCPELGWLDVFADDMKELGADIISGVISIKNFSGVTSTARDCHAAEYPNDVFRPTRRLTLKEVYERDPVFHEPDILLNTGLWLMKMKKWYEDPWWFRQHDAVVKNSDGEYQAVTFSEDWDFSRQAREHGMLMFASRNVHIYHENEWFNNKQDWGHWKTDEAYLLQMEGIRHAEGNCPATA